MERFSLEASASGHDALAKLRSNVAAQFNAIRVYLVALCNFLTEKDTDGMDITRARFSGVRQQ